jgi:hypothetical protein
MSQEMGYQHEPDYHPGIPSFRDEYKRIGSEIVDATYAVIFVPGRQRYITGGIATQYYIPPEMRRGSSDIDIEDLQRHTWGEFKQTVAADIAVASVIDSFEGYDLEVYERSHSFVLHVCNWYRVEKGKKHFFNTEFPKYSQGHFDRLKPTLERERDNARTFGSGEPAIVVLDPVDIISRKIIRLINFHEFEGFYIDKPPDSISDHLDLIWQQRRYLDEIAEGVREGKRSPDQYHLERTHLRYLCDQYDIRAMLRWADYDENYLNHVINSLIERGYDGEHVNAWLNYLFSSQS